MAGGIAETPAPETPTPEARLLLLISRVRPSVPALKQAQATIDASVDWHEFLTLCARHGTAGTAYRNLQGLRDVPEEHLKHFEALYNKTLSSNVRKLAELQRVLAALGGKGIGAICLKGPVASEVIFGDPGLYPSGDIDLLVRPEDMDGTTECLTTMGYSILHSGYDEYRDYFMRELSHISMGDGKFVIEPHWNLFFRYFNADPSLWWEGATAAGPGGSSYRLLSPESDVIYNSFRLFFKGFAPLRFLVILAELIRHYEGEMDWARLQQTARALNFSGVLCVCLRLAHELLGAPVPEEHTRLKSARARALYPLARRTVLGGTSPHPAIKALMIFLRDDLHSLPGLLARRLLPSMGEVVNRYGLTPHSGRAYLYYALNPLFVMLRYPRK